MTKENTMSQLGNEGGADRMAHHDELYAAIQSLARTIDRLEVLANEIEGIDVPKPKEVDFERNEKSLAAVLADAPSVVRDLCERVDNITRNIRGLLY